MVMFAATGAFRRDMFGFELAGGFNLPCDDLICRFSRGCESLSTEEPKLEL
jgi:hypothetical protein